MNISPKAKNCIRTYEVAGNPRMAANEANELMSMLGWANYSSVQSKLREMNEFVECGTKPTNGRPAKLYKLRDDDISVQMKQPQLDSDSDFLQSFLDVDIEMYSVDIEDIKLPGTDLSIKEAIDTENMDLSHIEDLELPRVRADKNKDQLEVRFFERNGVYGHQTFDPVEHAGGSYGYTYFIWDITTLLVEFSMVKIGKCCKKNVGNRFNELESRGGWRLLPILAIPSSRFNENNMHLRFNQFSYSLNNCRRMLFDLPNSKNLERDNEWFEYTSRIDNFVRQEYRRHCRLKSAWDFIQDLKTREIRVNAEGELSFEDSETPTAFERAASM